MTLSKNTPHSPKSVVSTRIMGIINTTPDSFSNDGLYSLEGEEAVSLAQNASHDSFVTSVVAQASAFVTAGCDILDIGGESTRPGGEKVGEEDEKKRVIPAITAIRCHLPDVPISIDTYKAGVAEAAIQAGASIINDVWGGMAEPDILEVARRHAVPICLMHNASDGAQVTGDGTTGMSYRAPEMAQKLSGEAFLRTLRAEMGALAENALAKGVSRENIWLDPGVGFGKTLSQNLEIIANISYFKALGYPVLLGASRKSFIGAVLDVEKDKRRDGTLATTAMAVFEGVDVVRVHDVEATVHLVRMMGALQNKKYTL